MRPYTYYGHNYTHYGGRLLVRPLEAMRYIPLLHLLLQHITTSLAAHSYLAILTKEGACCWCATSLTSPHTPPLVLATPLIRCAAQWGDARGDLETRAELVRKRQSLYEGKTLQATRTQ